MIGYHDKAILFVHSFEVEISIDHLPENRVNALNFGKENICVLEMDMVLHLEATLCHYPLIWHIFLRQFRSGKGQLQQAASYLTQGQ
jgi:hypothetical protein